MLLILIRKPSVGSIAITPEVEEAVDVDDMNYMLELEDLKQSVSTGRVAQQARRDSLSSLNSQMISRRNSFSHQMLQRRSSLTVPPHLPSSQYSR